MSWSDLADWWEEEFQGDPSYRDWVAPLLMEVLDWHGPGLLLDIGCGTGHVMDLVEQRGGSAHGVDVSTSLVRGRAKAILGDALQLPIREKTYDAAYSVLTLEHLSDHRRFFDEASRVVRAGGTLAIVINHPFWTAPNSTPIQDPDGEVLWRQGAYFSRGSTVVPAGDSEVTFHHRSMGDLLNTAASSGWCLEHMIEQPHERLPDQEGIPRLLACRWRLLP